MKGHLERGGETRRHERGQGEKAERERREIWLGWGPSVQAYTFCATGDYVSSYWVTKSKTVEPAFLLTALLFFAFWNYHDSLKGFKIYVFNFSMD